MSTEKAGRLNLRIHLPQPGWFQNRVRPRALRRASLAGVVGTLLVVSGLVANIHAVTVGGILTLLLAAFEILHLPKTKAIVESMSIQVAPDGLCFRFGPKPTEVLYPWVSASICDVRRGHLGVESFVIEDKDRKASRITVTGYEDMDELLATVEASIKNA